MIANIQKMEVSKIGENVQLEIRLWFVGVWSVKETMIIKKEVTFFENCMW